MNMKAITHRFYEFISFTRKYQSKQEFKNTKLHINFSCQEKYIIYLFSKSKRKVENDIKIIMNNNRIQNI